MLLMCEHCLLFMLVFYYLSGIFDMYDQGITEITTLGPAASGLSG